MGNLGMVWYPMESWFQTSSTLLLCNFQYEISNSGFNMVAQTPTITSVFQPRGRSMHHFPFIHFLWVAHSSSTLVGQRLVTFTLTVKQTGKSVFHLDSCGLSYKSGILLQMKKEGIGFGDQCQSATLSYQRHWVAKMFTWDVICKSVYLIL